MSDTETIALRVTESKKASWQEYADDNDEYDSLSHLIRVAVAHEMSDAYGPGGGSDGSHASDGRISEVLQKVSDLEKEVSGVQESVEAARKEVGSAVTEAPEITDVLSAVPPKSDVVDTHRDNDGDWVQDVDITDGKTAVDVANELNTSVGVVRESLRQLRVEYDRVECGEIDGVTYWVKDV